MAGHLDSESVFAVRLTALGVTQTQIATLSGSGVIKPKSGLTLKRR